jgi:hypothetical protein
MKAGLVRRYRMAAGESLSGPLHTLVVSGPWDTANIGGEEVDIDWLLDGPQPSQSAVTDQLTRAPAS